jgi:hypothetical protein
VRPTSKPFGSYASILSTRAVAKAIRSDPGPPHAACTRASVASIIKRADGEAETSELCVGRNPRTHERLFTPNLQALTTGAAFWPCRSANAPTKSAYELAVAWEGRAGARARPAIRGRRGVRRHDALRGAAILALPRRNLSLWRAAATRRRPICGRCSTSRAASRRRGEAKAGERSTARCLSGGRGAGPERQARAPSDSSVATRHHRGAAHE